MKIFSPRSSPAFKKKSAKILIRKGPVIFCRPQEIRHLKTVLVHELINYYLLTKLINSCVYNVIYVHFTPSLPTTSSILLLLLLLLKDKGILLLLELGEYLACNDTRI